MTAAGGLAPDATCSEPLSEQSQPFGRPFLCIFYIYSAFWDIRGLAGFRSNVAGEGRDPGLRTGNRAGSLTARAPSLLPKSRQTGPRSGPLPTCTIHLGTQLCSFVATLRPCEATRVATKPAKQKLSLAFNGELSSRSVSPARRSDRAVTCQERSGRSSRVTRNQGGGLKVTRCSRLQMASGAGWPRFPRRAVLTKLGTRAETPVDSRSKPACRLV